MKLLSLSRLFGRTPEALEDLSPAPVKSDSSEDATFLMTVGWITAGVGTVAIGLVLGREIRRRYKFNRRTPYDFYEHAGDERDLEFGVGI